MCRLTGCEMSFETFNKRLTVLDGRITERKTGVEWWLVSLLHKFRVVDEEFDGYTMLTPMEFCGAVTKVVTVLNRIRGALVFCTLNGALVNRKCETDKIVRLLCVPLYGVVKSEPKKMVTPVSTYASIINYVPSGRYDISTSDAKVAALASL